MQNYYIADGHCDTATVVPPMDLAFGSSTAHLDLPTLCRNSNLQFFAFFVKADIPIPEQRSRLINHITNFNWALEMTPGVRILKSATDVSAQQNLGAVLALEGADSIDGDLDFTDYLAEVGFRSMGLFWNNNNWVGCGADANLQNHKDTGLTEAGRSFVEYLTANHWLIDLAHSSYNSFWHVAEILQKPFFVSHTCCHSLRPHKRNLQDNQLKKLGDIGGVIGITFAPDFLTDGNMAEANIDWVIKHICHAVNVAGADAVAIGSDFDGITSLPQGIKGITDYEQIADKLMENGLGYNDVCKILGLNWRRFLLENLYRI